MNPPSALASAMGRERKPFTYTPGGIDLSQIKSEKMARRLMRNAMNPGVQEFKPQNNATPTSPTSNPYIMNLPVQVFPNNFVLPANPKTLLRSRSNPQAEKTDESNVYLKEILKTADSIVASTDSKAGAKKINGLEHPNETAVKSTLSDENKKKDGPNHKVRFEDEVNDTNKLMILSENNNILDRSKNNLEEQYSKRISNGFNDHKNVTKNDLIEFANSSDLVKNVDEHRSYLDEIKNEPLNMSKGLPVKGSGDVVDDRISIKCNGVESSGDPKSDKNNNDAEVTIKISSRQSESNSTKTVNVTKRVTIKEQEEEEEEEEIEEVEEEYDEVDEGEAVEIDDKRNNHNETDKKSNVKIEEMIETIDEEKTDAEEDLEEDEGVESEKEDYKDNEKEVVENKNTEEKISVITKTTEEEVEDEEEYEEVEEEEEYEEEEETKKTSSTSDQNTKTNVVTSEQNIKSDILTTEQESKKEIQSESNAPSEANIEVQIDTQSNKSKPVDNVVQKTTESQFTDADGATVTKKETTEIKTTQSSNDSNELSQTAFTRTEETKRTETTKTILKHDNLVKEEAPMKVYFPPIKHEVIETSLSNESSDFRQEENADRRHSLLLERLSVERQLPSAILQNKLATKNVTAKKQIFQQDESVTPQSSYHYKPQNLWTKETSSETVTQEKSYPKPPLLNTNIEESYVPPPAPTFSTQPEYVAPQQMYVPPPQEFHYAPEPQPAYVSPAQPNYESNLQQTYVPSFQQTYPAASSFVPTQQSNFVPSTQNYAPVTPQYQDYQPTQQRFQPPQSFSYNEPTYQQTQNISSNIYSNNYSTQANQQNSGYVPPPWANEPESPREAFAPQPSFLMNSSITKQTSQKIRSSKQPPLAYIPPAPNAAFNKPAKVASPKTKTYYSEYERRYISVPEQTYIPTQETQKPVWVKDKYSEPDEQSEETELPWRKELRELQERANNSATERRQTISNPEWQQEMNNAYCPPESQEFVEQPWRKELRELREQKSYSLSMDNPRPSWQEEQVSTVTRTHNGGQTQEERSFSSQVTRPPWQGQSASLPPWEQEVRTKHQETITNNSWNSGPRPASYAEANKTRPLSNYLKARMDQPQSRSRGVSVDRFVAATYPSPYSTMPAEDNSLPWEKNQPCNNAYTAPIVQNDYQLPWETPGYVPAMSTSVPAGAKNDYKFSWETQKQQAQRPQSAYHTLPRMHSEPRERTPSRNPAPATPRPVFGCPREQPVQSRSFKYLQMLTGTEDGSEEPTDFVMQPPQHSVTKPRRI